MICDVGKAREGLENELWRRWRDGKLGEWASHAMFGVALRPSIKYDHGLFHLFCKVGKLLPVCIIVVCSKREHEHEFRMSWNSMGRLQGQVFHLAGSFSKLSVSSTTSQRILQPFPRFTYVRTHSPTFPALHLRHISFSDPSVALPTSQLIFQSFRHFTYVTAHSPTLPSLYLRHISFSNPSIASPTSQLILQPFFPFS